MLEADDGTVRSSLSSITRGASLFFVGRLLAQFLKFILNLLLTRGLGASLYGIYAYAWTIVSIAVVLARFGTGQSLLRFIPQYEDDFQSRNRYVGLAYLTALGGSTISGILLFVFAPAISSYTLDTPLFIDVLRVFALVLPFNTIIKLTNAVFRGLESLEYQVLVADIAQPLTQIAVVGIALLLGYSLLGVVASLAIALILVSLLSVTILYNRTPLRPSLRASRSKSELVDFYNYSAPLTLKDVGTILYRRVDILMVGLFLAEATVGIYQVSVLVAGLIALPLNAFNQLFPPVASRLYTENDIKELESVYEIVTRWTLTLAIPPALVAGIYSSEVLSVFGSEFSGGTIVLTLFTVGHLTNCLVGPSGFLLMMTDHQYLNMVNQWLLGILNIILNIIFILQFGLIGAALATAGVLTLINIIRVVEVWYTESVHPYSLTFWKPITAGVVAGISMIVFSSVIQGFLLLVTGSLFGVCVFAGLLFVFGIEKHDREFFSDVTGDYIS